MKKYSFYTVFIANLLIIAGFWWSGSHALFTTKSSDLFLFFGRLTGLYAVYFILLQFVLMGRAVWIEKTFGLDKLANIHRLNGYLSITFIILHPIFVTIAYAMIGKITFLAQFIDFLSHYEDIPAALFAVILFVAIVFLSIYIVRKHVKYETWYYIHLLTYLAVVLAFGHQLTLGGDFITSQLFVAYWYLLYAIVFGNLLVFRILKPLLNFYHHRFFVSDIIQETDDTNSILISGKNLQNFKTEAGQFMIVRFLCRGFWWQAHPFSLSSVSKNNQLRITVKSCGDFTSQISNVKKGTSVMIEGPYGVFTAQPKIKTKYLFIAGGVGITPIRALIEKLASQGQDLMLLYSNKTEKDIIFKNELDQLAQENSFPIHYVITNQPDYHGEQGKIDQQKISALVKDIQEREVYFCGPPLMSKSLNEILRTLGLKRSQIHYEKFAF